MGKKKKDKDKKDKKDKEDDGGEKPSRKSSSKKTREAGSSDPKAQALIDLCAKEMENVSKHLSEALIKQVIVCERETVDLSCNRLCKNKVKISSEEHDIDRESRVFELG